MLVGEKMKINNLVINKYVEMYKKKHKECNFTFLYVTVGIPCLCLVGGYKLNETLGPKLAKDEYVIINEGRGISIENCFFDYLLLNPEATSLDAVEYFKNGGYDLYQDENGMVLKEARFQLLSHLLFPNYCYENDIEENLEQTKDAINELLKYLDSLEMKPKEYYLAKNKKQI